MGKDSLTKIKRTSLFIGINKVGKLIKFLGLDPFKLNADKIIFKSKKKAGYKGTLPKQLEAGVRSVIESVNKDAKLNSFGSLAAKILFERTLTERLKIEQLLHKDPEIERAEISQPIFIIGMPRTGTSILHALMHEDENHRSPLVWECLLPTPVPAPENYDENQQLKTVVKELDQIFKLVPDFKKKHHITASSPQECVSINAFDFNSFQFTAQFYVPHYLKWFFKDADRLSTMRFHKRFLQYLESGGVRSERWLLKSPVHLMRLTEIFEVYPDARVIMTHRHPGKVVPSVTSLISSLRSLYSDEEDLNRTGKEQVAIWSSYFNRFLESRKELNKEDQIIDLRFEDFVKDQMGTLRKIYNKFGWEMSELTKNKMEVFLAQNPKDKHGAHDYSLKDFGLDEVQIKESFAKYIQFLHRL